MRSLGQFFGFIAAGVRSDATRKEVTRTVEEERREGSVVLRKTVIEEVEYRGQAPPQETGKQSQENRQSGATE